MRNDFLRQGLYALYDIITRSARDRVKLYLPQIGVWACGIAGRVCYSHAIDLDDDRLGVNLIDYLDRIAKQKHFSIFAHCPVYIDVDKGYTEKLLYEHREIFNVFKLYFDWNMDGSLTILANLRHILEAFDIVLPKTVTVSYVLETLFGYESKSWWFESLYIENGSPCWDARCGFVYYKRIEDDYHLFYVRGVDRATTHQLVRHQTLNFNQQSQRYVRMSRGDVVPPYLVDHWRHMYGDEIADDMVINIRNMWFKYNELINNFRENRVLKEDARFVLTSATPSNIVISGWDWDIRRFIRVREHSSAQYPIRLIASKMRVILENYEQLGA